MNLTQVVKDTAARLCGAKVTKGSPPEGGGFPLIWDDDTSRVLWLDAQDFPELDACKKQIASVTDQRISEHGVEALLRNALVELHTGEHFSKVPHERVQQLAAHLKQQLQRDPDDWELVFVVSGIAPKGLPARVGAVEFYAADQPWLTKLQSRCLSIDKERPRFKTNKSYRHVVESNISKIRDRFEGQIAASVHVRALDYTAARAIAQREIRLILDCINFFADLQFPPQHWAYSPDSDGVRPLSGCDVAFVSSRTKEKENYFDHWYATAPLSSIHLPSLFSSQHGFARISEILANSKRNSLETRILGALQWSGRTRSDDRLEQAFLLNAIALESVLLGKKDTELSYRLAIRAAQILGAPDVSSRRQIAALVRALYGTRSKIVHSGNVVVAEADCALMMSYANTVLLRLLIDAPFVAMRSEEELEDWFELQALGGSTL